MTVRDFFWAAAGFFICLGIREVLWGLVVTVIAVAIPKIRDM